MVLKVDSIQSFLGEARKRLGISLDLMTFSRQSWFVSAGGIVGRSFDVFAATSGVLMSISAILLFKKTFETMAKAAEENDPRTFLLHMFTSLPSAISLVTVGFGMTTAKIAALAGKVGITNAASSVIPGAAMALSAANLVAGLYCEYTTGKLKDALDQILDPKESQNSISADLRRKAAIAMILRYIEESPREFERQTNPECLQEVLKLMEGESLDTLSPDKQKQILRLVYEINYRTNLKGRLLIAVSIVGLIACVTAMILTGGTAAPLIFIIGSFLWMSLDSPEISKRVGDWFWAHRKASILPEDLQEDGDSSPDSEVEFLGKNALAILFSPLWMIPSMIYLEGKVIYRQATARFEDDEYPDLMDNSDFTDGKFPNQIFA